MPVETVDVSTTPELVSAALSIRRAAASEGPIWYRGAAKESYPLLPKLLRDEKSSTEVFEREARLITRFRQRSLPFWPAGYPQDDWEQLFAMQHYGMPTRLLDWSENVFVAAHFALNSQGTTADDPPVIWCMSPVDWNRRTPHLSDYGNSIRILTTADEELDSYNPVTRKKRNRTPVAIFGTHNSERIVSQRGTFVAWGEDTASLEHFATQPNASTIHKIRLCGNNDVLRDDLDTLGFSESMVFPDISALSRELTKMEGWL